MASHGRIGEFNPQREDWTSYIERLKEYFIANDLEEATKQKAILLNVVGAESYQLMRSLTAPKKPTEKSFDQLVALVKEHHHPKPSVILQRFKFGSRRQKPGEPIANFVSDLRRLSEHCDFGETLDDMLRDRIVCGIADGRLQRRLLVEPDLSLKKALELAQAQETAEQGAQQLQQQRPQQQQQPQKQTEKQCYRCGAANHLANACRFQDAVCRNCNKKGHIARACRSRVPVPRQTPQRPSAQQPPARQTHQVAAETEQMSEDTADSYDMFNLQGTQGKPFIVPVQLNGCTLEMEIDTGASLSIISRDFQPKLNFWNSLWLNDWQYSVIFTDHFGENLSSIACSCLEI